MRCLKLWTCVVHLTLLCLFLDRVNAAPALTTIQDTLYKADGTRFNGVANIEWNSFQASDGSAVAASSVVVPIVDGVLRVRLVPTSNASAGAHYFVRYQADGRVQFIESWNVIPSALPVTLSMVRAASGSVGGTITPPPTLTVPDVTGLAEELANRPVKGFNYSTDRILKSGPTGALESVQGTLTDCIHVDGTSGPCGSGGSGSSGPGFVDQEVPTGAVNGSNTVYTTAQAPTPATSLQLYRNGVLMKPAVDYTLASTTITFGSASTPQTGDLLLASYRLSTVAGLTAGSPATEIAEGVIGNLNIASAAGIVESKLALNYQTHSNANDPSAREKAALSGTGGTPSASNKYVTDQDSRLSNARPAQGHFFLGAEHTDTTTASVQRGDLITGSFATGSAKWTRLPLGPANRCLVSNGSDAVWNTCLFTGFHAGTVPFTGADGTLVESPLSFVWDNSNRRLSVGSNLSASTLTVHDGGASGSTTLTVRAGNGQGSTILQSWQNSMGLEQASIGADGVFSTRAIESVSTSARPAWRELGATSDPVVRTDGDAWFNATELTHKTVEGGRTHTQPQVLCAAAGTTSTSTTIASLGTCTIPAGMANPGDRLAIRASWVHDGTAAYTVRWRWGSSTAGTLTVPGTINVVNQKGEVAPYDSGAVLESGTDFIGITAETAVSGITIGFEGNVTSGSENLRLIQFTVIRYPAQSNP
jgi:hypothetical protein